MCEEQENILNEYINRMLCISKDKDIDKDKQQIYIDKLKQAYDAHETDRTVYDDIIYSAIDDIFEEEYQNYESAIDYETSMRCIEYQLIEKFKSTYFQIDREYKKYIEYIIEDYEISDIIKLIEIRDEIPHSQRILLNKCLRIYEYMDSDTQIKLLQYIMEE